jgi:hypothetical protein
VPEIDAGRLFGAYSAARTRNNGLRLSLRVETKDRKTVTSYLACFCFFLMKRWPFSGVDDAPEKSEFSNEQPPSLNSSQFMQHKIELRGFC